MVFPEPVFSVANKSSWQVSGCNMDGPMSARLGYLASLELRIGCYLHKQDPCHPATFWSHIQQFKEKVCVCGGEGKKAREAKIKAFSCWGGGC